LQGARRHTTYCTQFSTTAQVYYRAFSTRTEQVEVEKGGRGGIALVYLRGERLTKTMP